MKRIEDGEENRKQERKLRNQEAANNTGATHEKLSSMHITPVGQSKNTWHSGVE